MFNRNQMNQNPYQYFERQQPQRSGNFRGGFRGQNNWNAGRNNWNAGGGSGMNKRPHNFGSNQNYGQGFKKPRPEVPEKRLSEEEVAISLYVSDHSGFNGIIKLRYSDFQVAEINEHGEIAKLTDLNPPQRPVEDCNEDEELLLSKYNLEVLPLETWDRINELALTTWPTSEMIEVDVTGMPKEHRTKIHDGVKRAFGGVIVGTTHTVGDKKVVRIQKYRKGLRIDKRVKWVWPSDFVHFVVHKENCDTMEAATRIAERLHISNVKNSILGYAGTKDRRAKTSQWFSARKIEPKRIADGCKGLRELHVGNFTFSETHINLGKLLGNRFRIALRNVTAEDDVVNNACQALRDNGFINYYGLQRFGTRKNIPTYEIGAKLLQSKYAEALRQILAESDDQWQGQSPEGRIRKALRIAPNDLLGALSQLPKNMRLLYIHSYQSLLWNRCATERLNRFGFKPVLGDLVSIDAGSDLESQRVAGDQEQIQETQDETLEPESLRAESAESTAEATTEKTEETPKKKYAKLLTQEDLDNNVYNMFDIVLPMPGFNIEYPPNMKDYYEEQLLKDDLNLELKHQIKTFSLAGTYRRLILKPEDLSWSIVRYNSPYGDLLLSDYDELCKITTTSVYPEGKYKALLLHFNLPSSSYATMALRELLRVDTAGDFQASQNNYHLKGVRSKAKTKPEDVADADDNEEGTSGSVMMEETL